MAKVELLVGGRRFEGWQEVTVTRHLEALCGGFSLALSDPWAEGSQVLPIPPGAACELRLGGETVISGYVDEAEARFDKQTHALGVAGRDKAADLVDCSAVHEPGEWRDQSLAQIAAALAKPFGVGVRVETDTGATFAKFAVEPGETAWEALERAGRQRGVLCISDARGGIVITSPGKDRAASDLIQGGRGGNVLRARGRFSLRDRHSLYVCQGQRPGTDEDWGLPVSTVRAECSDGSVARYRPLLITAETGADQASARARVEWEATVRAARGSSVQVTVQGWLQADGTLWRPNLLVRARLPYLRLDADLLVAGISHTLSDQGTLTELDLRRPDAYALKPEQPEDADPLKGLLPEDFNG